VDAAAQGQPQVVTRRGVETAVVISYQEYERLSAAQRARRVPFSEYLLAMPTTSDADTDIERIKLELRDTAF
jgi:prevent-host-death family protein